jgi:mRNA interferase RelE/StbE
VSAYSVQLTGAAQKELDKLPKKAAAKVLAALRDLREEPRPQGCKKLVGTKNTFRVRVGDYRVVYEVYDDKVLVLVIRVRHRKDAYRE